MVEIKFYKVTKREYKDYIYVYINEPEILEKKPPKVRYKTTDCLVTETWFDSMYEAVKYIDTAGGRLRKTNISEYLREIVKYPVSLSPGLRPA